MSTTIKLQPRPKFWCGKPPAKDDFGDVITDKFYDAKTKRGPWAIMSPANFVKHRITRDGLLGMGLGQEYTKQPDGKYLKTGG